MRDKIAICISTRNRPEAFHKCWHEWECLVLEHQNVETFYVDDASDTIYVEGKNVYCFSERVGIPRAKNKSLELAMDCGAEHIFLCDDDVYPISPHALDPYINSPFKHLCYTFLPHQRIVDGHKYHALGNG